MFSLDAGYSRFDDLSRAIALVGVIAFLIVLSPVVSRSQDDTKEPADAVALFNQAQDAHEKGDLIGAIKLYERAISEIPEFPEAEYQRAVALLALDRLDESEKGFRRAVELRADWTLAMTGLGSLLVTRGKYDEARPLLSRSIELDPQNSPAYAAMADLQVRTKASTAALTDLLAKITGLTQKANPTSAIWAARAAVENALGKREASRSSLSSSLAIDPKNKYALMLTVDIALAGGDTIRAGESVTALERIAPGTRSTRFLRARVLAAEGKLAEAAAILDGITDMSEAAELRGRIKAATEDNAADLEKTLAKDPANITVLGRLCTLFRKDNPEKALAYCQRASELEPRNIDHAVGYGAALVQAKMFDRAVGLFRQIIKVAPDNSTAHANLATALFELKRYAEAKPEYQWLAATQPELAIAYFFLGITHDQLGEYMDAMANYQLFLKHADPKKSQIEIEKVNLRLPALQRQLKEGKVKRSS